MFGRRQNGRSLNTNPFIIILCVLLAGGLMYMLYSARVQDRQQSMELQKIAQAEQNVRKAERKARRELEASDSFYQKLADGFDVSILVIGDNIGYGSGASRWEYTWPIRLGEYLQKKYGVRVNVENISLSGSTSYAGYVQTMALDEDADFDAAIICYGQNDRPENFGIYYEAIIRAVRSRFKNCSVMSILESSQMEYTDKIKTIQALGKAYDIPMIDTLKPFAAKGYEGLMNNSVNPNDAGYQVYCDTIAEVIDREVAAYREPDPVVEPVNTAVAAFDEFTWYPADDFEREDNTFTLETSVEGSIFGLAYSTVPGENSVKILIDGEEYTGQEFTSNSNYTSRRIEVVNPWIDDKGVVSNDMFKVERELKVVFGSEKEAEEFVGVGLSDVLIESR